MKRSWYDGQKVMIREFNTRPSHWNRKGYMDKWMGKVVTIKSFDGDYRYYIYEDEGDRLSKINVGSMAEGGGWIWRETDFMDIPILDEGDFEL